MKIRLQTEEKEQKSRSGNSQRKCSVKKTVFKKFAKFTGKHLCSGLFFNTASDLSLKFCPKRDSGTGAFL